MGGYDRQEVKRRTLRDDPPRGGECEALLMEKTMPMPQAAPPTEAQTAWLKAHQNYMRISHSRGQHYTQRGTLQPDGTFVPEAPGRPVMDGNGCFSVGVPVAQRGRR